MSGRYVPRKANASLMDGALPEAFSQYATPKVRTPNEIRVEADLKARIEQAERATTTTKRTKPPTKAIRATTASDRATRTDRLQGAIKYIESGDDKGPKGLLKGKLLGLQETFDAKIHTPVKVTEGEETKEIENPLGAFADQQKAAEENPGQYALEETSLGTEVYMPSTRTGFYKFIQDTYAKRFSITSTRKEMDPKACEKLLQTGEQGVTAFLYQEFIKEYLRQASPYRGLLVYHGLGSGKTCSAIAAAESLYGIANKKIIVMTPQSLRNNFIKEISFCGFRHYSLNNHWTKYNLLSLLPTAAQLIEQGYTGSLLQKNNLLILYGLSVLSLRYSYIQKLMERTEVAYKEVITNVVSGRKSLDAISANNNAFLWIPDYSKKPNFNELSPVEKDMVRFQIAETVSNRFEFISYNGISNAKLKALACDKTHPFDNAIIVIDEIHNLIRLMQGDIEPFLYSRPDKKRKITPEPVGVGHWSPLLCGREDLKYTRGYLFYRLLTGAKNSKIVGLSGTPIINVPEEIGIMANLMAGYIDTVRINIGTGNSQLATILEGIANKDVRVDYVRRFSGTSSQTVMISIFNEGYVKVFEEDGITFKGVVHSNEPNAQASINDVYKRVSEAFLKDAKVLAIVKDLSISPAKLLTTPEYKAYPRLPPDMDNFRAQFVDEAGLGIKKENEFVLKKRLTGIVSYYRRARPEFFPEIGANEVVQCEFSDHALGVYTTLREEEIEAENKKKDSDPMGELFSVVEKFSKGKNPSSYRFASRAACNYAFPGVLSKELIINRPYPSDSKEYAKEVAPVKDSTQAEAVPVPEEVQEDTLSEEERELIQGFRTETDLKNIPTLLSGLTKEEQEIVTGYRDGAAERAFLEAQEQAANEDDAARMGIEEQEGGMFVAQQQTTGGMFVAQQQTTGGMPSAVKTAAPIPYPTLLRDAMAKLNEHRATLFALNDEVNGLKKYSCKLYKILKKMEEAKGPVLMYSQYKTVEGLGVFAIALRANGYDQISFKKDLPPWQPIEFDEASIASFKKGPGAKRFITFSGEEDQRQRSAILAIFNGQWQQLTRSILKLFTESGFETNPDKGVKYVKGEIIKCIGITGAGAEGISLRNVRQVHIMEPFWNMARLEQVKGRAIRVCSHADLPVKDRVVDIYTYVSTFSKRQIDTAKVSITIARKDRTKNGPITSDQTVLEVATRKQTISNKLLKVIQEVSVDCGMNYADNYLDQEPLECFKYKVANEKKDPFMFEPDLEADKISTKSKIQRTANTGQGSLKLFKLTYKSKSYIVGPWQTDTNGSDYAYLYDLTGQESQQPIRKWKALGTVNKDPSRNGEIGAITLYSDAPEEETGTGTEGTEGTAEEEEESDE